MIRLEAFGESEAMAAIARRLDENAEIRAVRVAAATRPGHAVLVASVHAEAVDALVDDLHRWGVSPADVVLTREDVLGRSSSEHAESGLIWEDLLGMAARSARPIARYLAFMLVAGIIAGYGVLEYNGILVIGAMAISPDLLPITAIGVALVDRRAGLAWRAFLTLAAGMAVATGVAAVSAFAQDRLGVIPAKFNIDSTVLGSLTHVSNETIVVALAAGVAGMLALETRASSGVGVAVSVTTIPAAAYLGVALGLAERGEALGAFAVLATNVAMLVVGCSVTLVLQRLVARRVAASRRRQALSEPDAP